MVRTPVITLALGLLTVGLLAGCQADAPAADYVLPVIKAEAAPTAPFVQLVHFEGLTAHIIFEREWEGDLQQQVAQAFADGLVDQGFDYDMFAAPADRVSVLNYDLYVFVAKAFSTSEGSPLLSAMLAQPYMKSAPVILLVIGEERDAATLYALKQTAYRRGAIVMDALAVACPFSAEDAAEPSCDIGFILNEMYQLGYCTAAYWEQQ